MPLPAPPIPADYADDVANVVVSRQPHATVTALHYGEGSSDKFFVVMLLPGEHRGTYTVGTAWGRVGNNAQIQVLAEDVSLAEAAEAYWGKVRAKVRKGYWNAPQRVWRALRST